MCELPIQPERTVLNILWLHVVRRDLGKLMTPIFGKVSGRRHSEQLCGNMSNGETNHGN